MQVDRKLFHNLARTADLQNTINGGMSQALLKGIMHDDEWTLKLKIPGVDADNIKLELTEGHLCIFQMMEVQGLRKVPYLLSMIPMTRKIDIESISALHKDGWTYIKLPFDHFPGLERHIQITKK